MLEWIRMNTRDIEGLMSRNSVYGCNRLTAQGARQSNGDGHGRTGAMKKLPARKIALWFHGLVKSHDSSLFRAVSATSFWAEHPKVPPCRSESQYLTPFAEFNAHRFLEQCREQSQCNGDNHDVRSIIYLRREHGR